MNTNISGNARVQPTITDLLRQIQGQDPGQLYTQRTSHDYNCTTIHSNKRISIATAIQLS